MVKEPPSEVLDRVKEARKKLDRACDDLSKKIDQAIDEIRKNEQEIFKTDYKDWRTNG